MGPLLLVARNGDINAPPDVGGKSLSGNGSRRRMFYSDGDEPGRERSSTAPGTCSTSSRRGGEVAETREQGERLNVALGTQHSTDKPHAR